MADEETLESDFQHEKIKNFFRKDKYSIIALLPEIPYDINDANSCVSYSYIDSVAFFRDTGITYPRPSFQKKEADIQYTLDRTTKAEPVEYDKLKNILESHGISIEVLDEVDNEANQKRYKLINQKRFALSIDEVRNRPKDNINDKDNLSKFQKKPIKENFWKIAFQGFIIIISTIIGLFFMIAVVPEELIFVQILGAIIGGVVALCYFVGKWFSSAK
jgi:hypothetical protein